MTWQTDNHKTTIGFRYYKSLQESELTISDKSDVVLKNCLIIIPVSLRHKAVPLAHKGHQRLVKTKQLLREMVWSQNMINNMYIHEQAYA